MHLSLDAGRKFFTDYNKEAKNEKETEEGGVFDQNDPVFDQNVPFLTKRSPF